MCHFPFVQYFIYVFNDCYVSQYIPPWVYPAWDSVLPGLCWLFLFPCLGNFQLLAPQIFSQVLSLFSFWTLIMQILVHLVLLQRSVRLSSFLFILLFLFFFFFLFRGSGFHHSVFSVTYPFSASVVLLLILSSVFFNSVTVLFSPFACSLSLLGLY